MVGEAQAGTKDAALIDEGWVCPGVLVFCVQAKRLGRYALFPHWYTVWLCFDPSQTLNVMVVDDLLFGSCFGSLSLGLAQDHQLFGGTLSTI